LSVLHWNHLQHGGAFVADWYASLLAKSRQKDLLPRKWQRFSNNKDSKTPIRKFKFALAFAIIWQLGHDTRDLRIWLVSRAKLVWTKLEAGEGCSLHCSFPLRYEVEKFFKYPVCT